MIHRSLLIKPEEVESFTTLYEIMSHARDRYPTRTAYRQIEGKNNESQITFGRFASDVDALRAALLAHGLKGKHIALCGETSIEWITAYMAITAGVGICVPIDRELTPETMTKQLDYADADFIIASAKALRKLQKALPEVGGVNTCAVMRKDDVAEIPGCEEVISFTSLIEEGRALLESKGRGALPVEIDPDETCVIIYTSGTTGANKGVMLSNRNIMGTLRGCARLLHYPETSISVLPINHSYELHAHLMSCMYCGTAVCLNDDLKHILKNLEHFAPEMSCMVPMMLDLIVRKLKKGIADSGKQEDFDRAVALSAKLRKIGIDRRRQFFKDVIAPLGGNLRMIICGGAALSQETVDFLDAVGITVYNGYGITECAPVAAVNPSKKVKRNSVGLLLPTMKVRIADPDENGNGEIQLFGDNVMKGYYKAPDDTKQVFTPDGWFRTGDIGHVDKRNFLFLSGRLKNLIILPNGKNVYPEEVEDALMKHIPAIKECVVMENDDKTGIMAIIYLDRDFVREQGFDSTEAQHSFMQKEIDSFNSAVPTFKRLMEFEMTDREFEKSTTQKIQRFKIAAARKAAREAAVK